MSMVSQADLLWLAAIDDKTVKFFQQFDQRLDRMEKKHNQAFDSMSKSSEKSAGLMGLVGGAIGAVTHQLVAMGLQAVRAFEQLVKGSIQLAARADTLAISLQTVGGNAGYSAEELARLEEAVKANGITTSAARQILLKMAQANLDLSKAVELTRVAQDAAVIAGINSSQAAERMIHGITTLSPLILRHIGITVNLEQEYDKLTGGIEGAADSMSYEEKQAATLNAVLRQGAKIAGTYEAAMGTAGKQASSLARYQEELQLAIGRAFQPAYLEWIQFMTRTLKDAKEWFENNADAVENFGEKLGIVVRESLELLEKLGGALKGLGDIILILGQNTARAFQDISDEEMEKRTSNIGVAGKQLITLLVTTFVTGLKVVTESAKILYHTVAGALEFLDRAVKTPIKDWGKLFDEIAEGEHIQKATELWEGFGDTIVETIDTTMQSVGEFTGVMDSATEDVEENVTKVRDTAAAIAKETEEVVAKISKLNSELQKEISDLARKYAREDIEAEIREARRREDIARKHTERLADIYEDAAKDRVELIEDLAEEEQDLIEEQAKEREELEREYADERLEIETDYRRTLEDIQRSYELDVEEAARQNDAVAVARLMRQRSRQIADAKIDRDRSLTDAERNHNDEMAQLKKDQEEKRRELQKQAKKRMEDLEEHLAEQLQAAEDARQEDLANLERSLAQEKEDKERQRAWDEDDLRRKHEADLRAAGEYFSQLEFINESALQSLLRTHGQYIQDDLTLWEGYYNALRTAQQSTQYDPYGWGTPSPMAAPGQPGYYEEDPNNPQDVYTGYGGWGIPMPRYQQGGVGVAMRETQVTVGETPEIFAALPLSATVNYNHNINMSGDLNINGVSPNMESQVAPAVLSMLKQFGEMLMSGRSYGRARV